MQGMEPTQGSTGNIGGWDLHRELDQSKECWEYRYMVEGTVSLVQKGHHAGNGAHVGKCREYWSLEPTQRI